MEGLPNELDALAGETSFSGVVRVDSGGRTEVAKAYGLAHRAHGIPNELDTRFALASGVKGLTALTVVRLIEDGLLELSTPARSLLDRDLPLVDDRVTVEHLLAHRSGIGDYLDEESELDVDDYLMPVPVQELATTEQYLAVLDGHPQKFPPGERFAYCNSGYVALALLAERAAGVPFHELVVRRVCEPAGMSDTEFLRSDELPDRTALGYVGNGRTNVFHLPVRGSGDGGVYSTVGDVHLLWQAFFEGRIVSREWVDEMLRPRSERYGLGFWLNPETGAVRLEGVDAGVSFRSVREPGAGVTYSVISNTSAGAWPIARFLDERLSLSGATSPGWARSGRSARGRTRSPGRPCTSRTSPCSGRASGRPSRRRAPSRARRSR
jgi:CubicO group peptidase (beta-lactamase class C family)